MNHLDSIETIARREAAHLIRWYLHPAFVPVGSYEGVSLGECAEWPVYSELVRVLKYKMTTEPAVVPHVSFQDKCGQLVQNRPGPPPAARQTGRGSPRNPARRGKPVALVSVLRQHLVMLKALWATNAFDLVVEHSKEGITEDTALLLESAGIQADLFDTFVTDPIQSRCETLFNERLPLWNKAIESASFRSLFSFGSHTIFPEVKEVLDGIFRRNFFSSMIYIEALKGILKARDVALLLLWIDYSPRHRPLALYGQQRGIPVLHVSHSIAGFGVYQDAVCSDRVVVFGEHARHTYLKMGNPPDKAVITGNPEWDKFSVIPKTFDKEALCRHFGLDPGKPILLYATFWDIGPLYAASFDLSEHFFRHLLRVVKRLRSESPIQLVVKLHPAETERLPWFRNVVVEEGMEGAVVETRHVEELVFLSDLVICRGSNIGIEALLLEKPVVTFGTLYGADKATILITDPAELEGAVRRALLDGETRDCLARERDNAVYKFNYLSDGRATERVLAVVEEMTGIRCRLPKNFIPFTGSIDGRASSDSVSGSTAQALMEQGRLAETRGEMAEALKIYREIRKQDPSHVGVLKRMGGLQLRTGALDEAQENLKAYVARDPQSGEGRLLLALALYHLRAYEESLKHLKIVMGMDSAYAQEKALACSYAGNCMKASGDTARAEEFYKQALQLDPDSVTVLKEMGSLYVQTDRLDLAAATLKRVVEKDPGDAEALNDLGVLFFQQGDREEARSYLERARSTAPDFTPALLNLVDILVGEENVPDALEHLQGHLALHPEDAKIKSLYATLKTPRG